MIYSFGAKNYLSFREGMDVSFELNSNVPDEISLGKDFTTVLGVKGANASGKTSILRCLYFISHFVSHSFGMEDGEDIAADSFFRSTDPVDFYIDFAVDNVRYTYELSVTREKVIREALYRKVARKVMLFERVGNRFVKKVSQLDAFSVIKLRDNASVISTAVQYNLPSNSEDVDKIHKFFARIDGNVGNYTTFDDEFYSVDLASSFYNRNPEALDFAKKIISKSDLGISDIRLIERDVSKGVKSFFPLFYHNNDCPDDDQSSRWLTSHNESSGTVALYTRLFLYWRAIQKGSILIMDEFDVHCHPMLLPHLIELFLDPVTNPNNAQFIFTAHSIDIMDFLGKYRVILVNKKQGESFCYRLDEIPGDILRNDRPISPIYRDGKIGGVPHYG